MESSTRSSPRAFCLFSVQSRALAVPLEVVTEVVEVDRLVPVPLSPSQLLGLTPFRRDVVPVVLLAEGPAPAPGDPGAKHAALIMKTDQGIWGLAIDHGGIAVASDAQVRLQQPSSPGGDPAVVATLDRGGVSHALLDPGRVWRDLREQVNRWYVLWTA